MITGNMALGDTNANEVITLVNSFSAERMANNGLPAAGAAFVA